MDVQQHYDTLLADHYTWMVGDFEATIEEQRQLLRRLGVPERTGGHALDLGCGPGYQALALNALGYWVTAFDTSRRLLDVLEAHRGGMDVQTVHGDLREFPALKLPPMDVVVCMGDTLTHLDNPDDVARLFADIALQLKPDGRLILSYRDLSRELTGTDRFIPVRADADRVMTCVLEYEPETVLVTDLIHQRQGDAWRLAKSQYRKLRLPVDRVISMLHEAGLAVVEQERSGAMVTLAACLKAD